MRLLLILAAAAGACAAVDHPVLSGTWTLDGARSHASEVKSGTLTIEDAAGELRIREDLTRASGKKDNLDLRCNTMGKECALKDDGEPVRVSVWYNGPKLVVMETRGKKGDVVVKKRFGLSEDGTLMLELIPIDPAGEKQVLVFTKQ